MGNTLVGRTRRFAFPVFMVYMLFLDHMFIWRGFKGRNDDELPTYPSHCLVTQLYLIKRSGHAIKPKYKGENLRI